MKAVLSLTRLYFSVFPIQRWLPWISVGLVAFFIVIFGTRWGISDYQDMAKGASIMLAVAVVLSLFPALFTAGPLFRYLSAPPSYRLLPYFRLKMLLSLGVWFLVLFCLPASVAVFIVTSESVVSPIVPLATIFAFISGTFYFCFRLTAPSPRTFFEIVAFLVLLQLLADFEDRYQVTDQIVVFAAILMAVAWIVFVAWYLRAGTVSPVARNWNGLEWQGRRFREWQPRLPDDVPRNLAVTTILRGRPSRSLSMSSLSGEGMSSLLLVAGAAIGIGFLVGTVVSHDDSEMTVPIEFVIAMASGVGMGVGTHLMSSRVRMLWLISGVDRLGMFRVFEIETIKLAANAVVFLGLTFAGIQLGGVSINFNSALLMLALALGCGLSAIYVGLFRARNLGLIEALGWILTAGASLAAYFAYRDGHWPQLVPIVVAGQIILAFILRWVAIKRWRKVDWLEFKPFNFVLYNRD